MTTPASNAQSAIRSNVESKKGTELGASRGQLRNRTVQGIGQHQQCQYYGSSEKPSCDTSDEGNHNGSDSAYDRHRICGQTNGYQRFGKRLYEFFEWCAKMF